MKYCIQIFLITKHDARFTQLIKKGTGENMNYEKNI